MKGSVLRRDRLRRRVVTDHVFNIRNVGITDDAIAHIVQRQLRLGRRIDENARPAHVSFENDRVGVSGLHDAADREKQRSDGGIGSTDVVAVDDKRAHQTSPSGSGQVLDTPDSPISTVGEGAPDRTDSPSGESGAIS